MPADTVTRIDARLTGLTKALHEARRCGYDPAPIRQRIDSVLESRFAASRETAMRELAAVIKG